jgi:hypothetical protein
MLHAQYNLINEFRAFLIIAGIIILINIIIDIKGFKSNLLYIDSILFMILVGSFSSIVRSIDFTPNYRTMYPYLYENNAYSSQVGTAFNNMWRSMIGPESQITELLVGVIIVVSLIYIGFGFLSRFDSNKGVTGGKKETIGGILSSLSVVTTYSNKSTELNSVRPEMISDLKSKETLDQVFNETENEMK